MWLGWLLEDCEDGSGQPGMLECNEQWRADPIAQQMLPQQGDEALLHQYLRHRLRAQAGSGDLG